MENFRGIEFLTAALLLAGCQTTATTPSVTYSAIPLTPNQLETVQAGVRGSLKDPGSAQFGKIVAAQNSNGETAACGTVNARNSFGGYTGMKAFVASIEKSGRVTGIAIEGSGYPEGSIRTLCQRRGMIL